MEVRTYRVVMESRRVPGNSLICGPVVLAEANTLGLLVDELQKKELI